VTAAYRLTPRAAEGFRHITHYVDEHFGSVVAEPVVDELERFEQLAANPGLGHRREDLTADETVRFWPAGPTLIAYRERPSGLEVLFVERAERDWDMARPTLIEDERWC
jgi:plasmid stabilization system protein ParE